MSVYCDIVVCIDDTYVKTHCSKFQNLNPINTCYCN